MRPAGVYSSKKWRPAGSVLTDAAAGPVAMVQPMLNQLPLLSRLAITRVLFYGLVM